MICIGNKHATLFVTQCWWIVILYIYKLKLRIPVIIIAYGITDISQSIYIPTT